jgi:hypothetical protein
MTLDGAEPQHDDGAVQALFRALAPYQPPGSQPQMHPGYGSCLCLSRCSAVWSHCPLQTAVLAFLGLALGESIVFLT